VNVIIVGCGRVGVELALALHRGNGVAVVDPEPRAFDRLGPAFSGRTVQGDGLDRDTLQRAGIESAHALAAVTASDNVNAIVARVARDVFGLQRVVTRLYNPRRLPIYEKLGLQTVSSSAWGAQRIEQLLLHPGMQSVYGAGNGEVQVYEMSIPAEWSGRSLADLVPSEGAVAVALTRAGMATLPGQEFVLAEADVLHVSATDGGVRILRERLHANGHDLARSGS
jgi:trk system potassium uptake protein TrkA